MKDVTVRHVPMNITYEYEGLDMVERGIMVGRLYGGRYTIDAYTITQMGICEDFCTIANGQRSTSAAG